MPLLIIVSLNNSAQDPDPLDPQDFGVLDPDPQKYAHPKKCLLSKPKSELLKKRDYKIFLISKLFIKFQHTNQRTK